MPREHRLAHPLSFKRCFDQGKRFRYPGGYAVIAPNNCGHPRLGVIISKKVAKLAVVRNRMKRYHREIFRQNKDAMLACDVVIVCLQVVDYQEVEAQWQSMFPSHLASA